MTASKEPSAAVEAGPTPASAMFFFFFDGDERTKRQKKRELDGEGKRSLEKGKRACGGVEETRAAVPSQRGSEAEE